MYAPHEEQAGATPKLPHIQWGKRSNRIGHRDEEHSLREGGPYAGCMEPMQVDKAHAR